MKIPDDSTRSFIQLHRHDNIHNLALQNERYPDVDMDLALRQIAGFQKAKLKLPSLATCEYFYYPSSEALEQCSSEQTASYKSRLLKGATVIDLTGGLGIDTFYFAREATKVDYVEQYIELCEIMQHNCQELGYSNVTVHHESAAQYLQRSIGADTLYLDPSRRIHERGKIIDPLDSEPNPIHLKDLLMNKAVQRVIIKLSPMADIKKTLVLLPETSEIHVVAVQNECKELLFILDKNPSSLSISAINIDIQNTYKFVFTEEEELNALPELASEPHQYIYEPNSAILKAGSFKTIATRFGLKKFHQHSHLYTSSELISDFPGRSFKLIDVTTFQKKELRNFLKGIQQANVAIRNFPISAEVLKKKLKLKDGGELFIFGTTDKNGKHLLLKCTKAILNF